VRSLSSSFCTILGPTINDIAGSSCTDAIELDELAWVVIIYGTLFEGLVSLSGVLAVYERDKM
jgi:hypothetical protein